MRRGFSSSGGTTRKVSKQEQNRFRAAQMDPEQAHRAHMQRVMEAMPDIAEAQKQYDAQNWDEAEQAIIRVIHDHGLKNPMTFDAWGSCAQFQGRLDFAIECFRKALEVDPAYRVAHDRIIMLMDAQPQTTAAKAQRERTRWWERHGQELYARRRPHSNSRDQERPLRIGYVSGDYQYHSAATVFHRIVMNHTAGFIPYLYSSTPTKFLKFDSVTHGFMSHPHWRQTVEERLNPIGLPEDVPWPDWQVAEKIRHDEIDILVDLSGYTANNRLAVFCMKPAPIQITGWGYATGVGWPAMDYLVTDRIVVPEDRQDEHVEKMLYLPSVIDYEPIAGMPEATLLPCLTERPTFGVFQRSLKINAEDCDVWRQVLERLPESRLIFKSHYCETFKTWTLAHFKDQARQVEFRAATSSYEHKVQYGEVDLCLDPWPQTGGVSACDALWQGVPAVTLIGPRVIQRTTASLLTTLGLEDFIADTPEAYVEKAVAWVTVRKSELAEIRQGLRARCEASPIRTGYLESTEAAYRQVWRDWCAQPATTADLRYKLEMAI